MAHEITVTYVKTYRFEGDLLKEYLEQLDDHPDTPEQRQWFAVDRFIDTEAIDPSALLDVKERNYA